MTCDRAREESVSELNLNKCSKSSSFLMYLLNFVGIPDTIQDPLLISQTVNRSNQYRDTDHSNVPCNSGPSLFALGGRTSSIGCMSRSIPSLGHDTSTEIIGNICPAIGGRESNLSLRVKEIPTGDWIFGAGLDSGSGDKGSRHQRGKTLLCPRLRHEPNTDPRPCR